MPKFPLEGCYVESVRERVMWKGYEVLLVATSEAVSIGYVSKLQ